MWRLCSGFEQLGLLLAASFVVMAVGALLSATWGPEATTIIVVSQLIVAFLQTFAIVDRVWQRTLTTLFLSDHGMKDNATVQTTDGPRGWCPRHGWQPVRQE